jgi:hypothetical protein
VHLQHIYSTSTAASIYSSVHLQRIYSSVNLQQRASTAACIDIQRRTAKGEYAERKREASEAREERERIERRRLLANVPCCNSFQEGV